MGKISNSPQMYGADEYARYLAEQIEKSACDIEMAGRVEDLEEIVGDETDGLVADVAALEESVDAIEGAVTASSTTLTTKGNLEIVSGSTLKIGSTTLSEEQLTALLALLTPAAE